MSWQGYIDSSLVGSGHIDKAAIFSAAGDSVWAESAGFGIKPDEMKTISDILSGTAGAADTAYGEGVHVAGERYVVTTIATEDNIMILRRDKQGAAIAKTKSAIVLGHYHENAQPGNARATVEALADYLRKAGY